MMQRKWLKSTMSEAMKMGCLCMLVFAGILLGTEVRGGKTEPLQADDTSDIIKKPIPEKLVVLTFDDGCASHATIAAPILKKHGFGGTFYVSDAYLFRERKDWYMTWGQIRGMAEDGFEIGNHTRGHGSLQHTDVGGCQAYVWTLEDEMIANRIPKPTTFCWPFYLSNPRFYPLLKDWGYKFARGGYGRAYRPTVDNPYDVPSFAVGGVWMSMEGFIKAVQQATTGRVAVLCFHGVPDGEHAGVGTDPDLFEDMMEYLKDNNYKVIAMRDLAQYIDVEKAAKLPPTQTKVENTKPQELVKGDKPYVPKKRDRRSYTFPRELTAASTAKKIYRMRVQESVYGAINDSKITLYVPVDVNIKAIAPTFDLARFATANPASGTVRDFSNPQIYTVTAQDKSTRDYTVQVVQTKDPVHYTWVSKDSGSFEDSAQWRTNLGGTAAPAAGGNSNIILNFYAPAKYEVLRDGASDFVLNQLNFGSSSVTLNSKHSLVFSKNRLQGYMPHINSQNRANVTINAPIRLDADTTFDGLELDDTRVFINNTVSGSGALIKNGPHSLYLAKSDNTYTGGTIINDGSISASKQGLGTGPVTVNKEGAIGIGGAPVPNQLTAIGGRVFSGGSGRWSGPVTLKGCTTLSAVESLEFTNKEGGISGPGGFTLVGHRVDHATKFGTVKLSGRNTYTGATKVEMGLLEVTSSLYSNETTRWTPENITVNGAAGELRLHVGAPDAFTIEQASTMLKNICRGVNHNGMLAGSTFGLNIHGTENVQDLTADVTDSEGPGGGRVVIKKCGTGTLKLSGANTYSGATILEGGTLSVDSLNSVQSGKASSSLGAPKTASDAEIMMSGGCTLNYTGKGETTDRTLNLCGGNDTVVLAQSGTGLLRLTSSFVISGYRENKSLVLSGSGVGLGELAGNVDNPYDRAKKTKTSVTKLGTGTWKLSGINTYTGTTTVNEGTLVIANKLGLSPLAEVHVLPKGTVSLDFTGDLIIAKLYIDGKLIPAGTYGADSFPKNLKGQGTLTIKN